MCVSFFNYNFFRLYFVIVRILTEFKKKNKFIFPGILLYANANALDKNLLMFAYVSFKFLKF